MERKRGVEGEGSSHLPPSKQFRHTTGESPSAIAVDDRDEANGALDDVQIFQRAQLTALVEDQRREMKWLNAKVEELQQLVAVLDAAPRAALYHMSAVREDLTLTLARLGLNGDLFPDSSPLAATLLDAEVITNESLGEVPRALKDLSAQIVLALESKHGEKDQDGKLPADATSELHGRVRQVSDQLERYAERDKQSLVSSTTLKDELDDMRAEATMRRKRIVSLELALKKKNDMLSSSVEKSSRLDDGRRGDASRAGGADNASIEKDNRTYGHGANKGMGNDEHANHVRQTQELLAAEKLARGVGEKRLEELKQMHEERKQFISDIETLRGEIAKRDNGVVPMKSVLGSALYQTMEATLQQLYLKERKWQEEREAQIEEREEERKRAEERLAEERQAAERVAEDYRRQVEDLRRNADIAKAEKDKVVMTYEARKMEAGNAAAIVAAADKRVAIYEEMREKLVATNTSLQNELAASRSRVAECERLLSEKCKTVRASFCTDFSLLTPTNESLPFGS